MNNPVQKLTEDYRYADILHSAARCKDDYEQVCKTTFPNIKLETKAWNFKSFYAQMAMVAAFAVSSLATQKYRCVKPLDPLLGETYECDRSDDLGWRCFSEQVSSNPLISAQGGEFPSGLANY